MSSQVATGKVIDLNQVCVKVLPYRQLSISPEGEILVKGEVLFKGYITGNKLNLPLTVTANPPLNVIARNEVTKQSTVSQVNAVLKGWRDLIMALSVVMSFLRTATMTTL
jgi:hypothetical protein